MRGFVMVKIRLEILRRSVGLWTSNTVSTSRPSHVLCVGAENISAVGPGTTGHKAGLQQWKWGIPRGHRQLAVLFKARSSLLLHGPHVLDAGLGTC